MIEFKADCGHTIRAKDEDAGKVVRCSYCGREAQVPVDDETELDYLFSELEASEAEAKGAPPRTVHRGRRRPPGTIGTGRPDTGFNPFALVLKMGYAAAIIIVLILVFDRVFEYWTSPERQERSAERQAAREEQSDDDRSERSQRKSTKLGLLAAKLSGKKGGIYVNSVPTGAMIRVRPKGTGDAIEVFRDLQAEAYTSNAAIELAAGHYEVGVAIRVNDSHLRTYPDYRALRHEIDSGAPTAVLEAYFLPDNAYQVTTVELLNRPILLVRKYKCEVVGKEWTPLTALFLPDKPVSQLIKFLPRKNSYGFDDADVEWELDYYGVQPNDWKYITKALHRVGMVMYRNATDSTYSCFMIHLEDGSVITRSHRDHRNLPDRANAEAAPAPAQYRGNATGAPR